MRRDNFADDEGFIELYTDEAPGLKVDPFVVMVLSIGFIISVVALHSESLEPIQFRLVSIGTFIRHGPFADPNTAIYSHREAHEALLVIVEERQCTSVFPLERDWIVVQKVWRFVLVQGIRQGHNIHPRATCAARMGRPMQSGLLLPEFGPMRSSRCSILCRLYPTFLFLLFGSQTLHKSKASRHYSSIECGLFDKMFQCDTRHFHL